MGLRQVKGYAIWGSAGHAKVLASLVWSEGQEVVALFDNDPNAVSAVHGVPLFLGEVGFEAWANETHSLSSYAGLVAIGGSSGLARLRIHEMFASRGLQTDPVVHSDASVCKTASIGQGSQILAGSVVAADARIGRACIVNHSASVDHECTLDDGVHIAPGATLAGNVDVGSNVMIGAGAIILPRVRIGSGCIVGAGSVVTRDIPAETIAYGSPAKPMRARSENVQGASSDRVTGRSE